MSAGLQPHPHWPFPSGRPTFTVTAVSDWRVTVLEDRGDGHTTNWELPISWVDGPVVGEPLRGVVLPPWPTSRVADVASMKAAGVELAHAADQFIRKSDEWRPGCVRLQEAIQAAFAVFGMRAPEAAKVAPEAGPVDYEALIHAANLRGYPQGTRACVAFAKGAEWQAKQSAAAPQVAQPQPAPEHVCGLSGFGALGDVCPACAQRRAEWDAEKDAPQVAQPLAITQAVELWGNRADGPSTTEIVSYCRLVERACAEKWGVKLAGEPVREVSP